MTTSTGTTTPVSEPFPGRYRSGTATVKFRVRCRGPLVHEGDVFHQDGARAGELLGCRGNRCVLCKGSGYVEGRGLLESSPRPLDRRPEECR